MTLKDLPWALLAGIAIAAGFRIGDLLMPREPVTYFICIQEPGAADWQCSEHTDDTHPTTAPRSWQQRVDPPAEALVHATPHCRRTT